MKLRALAAIVTVTVPMLAGAAVAQSVKLLGEFRDWTAYTATEFDRPGVLRAVETHRGHAQPR